MLKDGDYGQLKDPDANIYCCVSAAAGSSDGPHLNNEIYWAKSASSKEIWPGCNFVDNLENNSQCVLCDMKAWYYCHGRFNKDK